MVQTQVLRAGEHLHQLPSPSGPFLRDFPCLDFSAVQRTELHKIRVHHVPENGHMRNEVSHTHAANSLLTSFSFYSPLLFSFFFETTPHYVAEAGFDLELLLQIMCREL